MEVILKQDTILQIMNLGIEVDRAVKHWIIAANLGCDEALDAVKKRFQRGDVSKEEYASSLRGHQAAVDATKSQQRDNAEKARQEGLLH